MPGKATFCCKVLLEKEEEVVDDDDDVCPCPCPCSCPEEDAEDKRSSNFGFIACISVWIDKVGICSSFANFLFATSDEIMINR